MKKRITAVSDFYSCDIIVEEKKIKSTLEFLVAFCKRQREKFVNKDNFITNQSSNEKVPMKLLGKMAKSSLWSEKIQLTVNIYPID